MVMISIDGIPSCSDVYIETDSSIWDQDVTELADKLITAGFGIRNILEEHRTELSDKYPRKIEVIVVDELLYGSRLEDGYSKTALMLQGESFRLDLKDGKHKPGLYRGHNKVGDTGITVFLSVYGSMDARLERLAKIEEIVTQFYN